MRSDLQNYYWNEIIYLNPKILVGQIACVLHCVVASYAFTKCKCLKYRTKDLGVVPNDKHVFFFCDSFKKVFTNFSNKKIHFNEFFTLKSKKLHLSLMYYNKKLWFLICIITLLVRFFYLFVKGFLWISNNIKILENYVNRH